VTEYLLIMFAVMNCNKHNIRRVECFSTWSRLLV